MKTFEDCIVLIEHELGFPLLTWQKDVLQNIYENKPYYYRPARGMGMTTLEKAALLLAILKKEE